MSLAEFGRQVAADVVGLLIVLVILWLVGFKVTVEPRDDTGLAVEDHVDAPPDG